MRALHRLSRYVAIAVLSLVIMLGAGIAVTQTSWFKNWLRQKAVSQAAQYLNGELTITRLTGNIFTGIALEGVALRHEGQIAVAMDRLTVEYSPLTMISDGLIFDSMTLHNPSILLQRDDAGWNFSRFVKTRRNTGGRGAPPITMQSIAIDNGHLIVRDRGRLVEDLTRLNTQFRFAYEKPGIAVSIGQFSADAREMKVRRLAGDLRFDRGSIRARDLAIETDRTKYGDGHHLQWAAGAAARASARCRATVAARDRPVFPTARQNQPRARGYGEGERHARRTQHGRRGHIVCGYCARTARRSFRRRHEKPRRAARREQRRHGAHSQPRRMEDACHGTGRLQVDVQPGRDRFQVRRSAR